MNAAEQMTHCPPDETLAAFADGRLGPEERQSVIEHMAECAECRDVLLTAGDLAEEAEERPAAPVVPIRRSWFMPAASMAAAAAIGFVLFMTVGEDLLRKRRLGQLARAVEQLDERPIAGRVSLPVAYRDYKPRRGGGESTVDPQYIVHIAAHKIAERAEKRETVANLHAAGIALLMLENPEQENTNQVNYKQIGVELIEKALAKQTGRDDVSQAIAASSDADLLNDLAAGYYAVNDKKDELAIDRAWALKQAPHIAWTRATIKNTKQAWNDYLKLDDKSEWADEVRRKHLD